jgi:hypothetical protein
LDRAPLVAAVPRDRGRLFVARAAAPTTRALATQKKNHHLT